MICGVDFGTSNSSCTLYDPRTRRLRRVVLDPLNERDPHLLRSLLFFPDETHEPMCGISAMQGCAHAEGEGRFVASIKSHLPSPGLAGTEIGGRQYTLSHLVSCLLRRIKAALPPDVEITRLNAGRPVRFSEDGAEDSLAQNRLAEAYRLAGFPEPRFVPEPIAAAHVLGEQVPRGVRVLVCDFGGGTLDFSLVVFEEGQALTCDVLATHGIWLGGDLIDGILMYRLFREDFGAGVQFWNWDRSRLMPLPSSIFTKLSHWRNIWSLRQIAEELRNTVQWGVTDAVPLERLLYLLEDLVAPVEIFAAIERAKVELSDRPASRVRYERGPIELDRPIQIAQFEQLVAGEVVRFRDALLETLRRAQLAGEEVEMVLCTGGSSQIPCFQRELTRLLPKAELIAPDYFSSVSQGLARFEA